MIEARPNYELTLPEFCLFDMQSRLSLLKMHGRLIYFDFVSSRMLVIIHTIYGFYIKEVRLINENVPLEVEPLQNGEDFSKYLNLRGMDLHLILS